MLNQLYFRNINTGITLKSVISIHAGAFLFRICLRPSAIDPITAYNLKHMFKRNLTIYLLALFAMPLSLLAVDGPQDRTIDWGSLTRVKISDTRVQTQLGFAGASYDVKYGDLPVYSERFRISSVNTAVNAVLLEQQWEDIEGDMKSLNGADLIGSSPEVLTAVAVERKQPYAVVSFVPLRKNPSTGRYQKLLSFSVELRLTEQAAPSVAPSRSYRQNSVLASGNWYKVSVVATGVYKITYSDLQSMGMNPSAIDPRNIAVYGNGGGMLPEACDGFRYDDLMENAIFVSGESDGSFDPGDYVLFYGQSPHEWTYNPLSQKFEHLTNIYSDYTYYFITADLGPGKRIAGQASSALAATHEVITFTDHKFIDEDELNIVRTGRDWFESPPYEIQTSVDYAFSFQDIDILQPVKMKTRVAARSSTSSNFKYYLNGSELVASVPVQAVSFSTDQYANTAVKEEEFNVSTSSFTLKVDYSKPLSGSIGWMDYIALNARRFLRFPGGQMGFRDPLSVGAGNISEYTLSGTTASTVVWNITDPLNIMRVETSASTSGGSLKFKLAADSLSEFIAFDGSSFYSVNFVERIENQNLHGLSAPDLVIISHAGFIGEANRLAAHHRDFDGMDVVVTDIETVYNEFSSGAQDITAIRDFMKLLYDEAPAGQECRYLILFGDASYDYKDRIDNNSNFVPTWADKRSMNLINSIATDDYYGFLDDGEGGGGNNLLDLGIGRIGVSTQEQAVEMVDKFIHYCRGGEDVYGSWRNVVCFVADDEDGNLHMQSHAEKMAFRLDTAYGELNIDKIYLDAYPQLSTSGGQRAPLVNDAINSRMSKGALIMNYTGHGGEAGWAHERILSITDVNNWSNFDKLPIFITATCEFSRYDDPTRISAGELVLLNPQGGAVALFTTARATYGSPNFELNNAMYDFMFEKVDGEYPRFGDLIRNAKNKSGSISDNDRKFILLGDPAMQLAYPKHTAITLKINDISVTSQGDTLKALQKVSVEGELIDENGNQLSNYNGILRPTIFDKPTRIQTLVTDPDSKPFTFELLQAKLFNGKANITNGKFKFNFIVPKDIAYKYGFGKISYYASNADTDASGYYKKVVIGGYDNNAIPDNTGPEIELYMNDESFAFGGITDENPVLLAYVSDSSGINTVGTGIGHDIVTTLDGDNNKSVIINDFYESDVDSYTSGVIRYPYSSLSDGSHSLKLKVWDVHNNSSEAFTEFVVAESAELAIEHVLNYPNPFTTSTAFYFDHNQPNAMLEVQVQIFTVSGRLIKTIDEFVMTNGFRSDPIYWDGLDDYGDKIGRGVYIYKMRVRSSDGSFAEKLEKLVILR